MLGFKHVLFLLATFPATEKNLSDGVEVAGIPMTALQNCDILGNLGSLVFHQSRMFVYTFS